MFSREHGPPALANHLKVLFISGNVFTKFIIFSTKSGGDRAATHPPPPTPTPARSRSALMTSRIFTPREDSEKRLAVLSV